MSESWDKIYARARAKTAARIQQRILPPRHCKDCEVTRAVFGPDCPADYCEAFTYTTMKGLGWPENTFQSVVDEATEQLPNCRRPDILTIKIQALNERINVIFHGGNGSKPSDDLAIIPDI